MNLKDLLDPLKQKRDDIEIGVVKSSGYIFLLTNLKGLEDLLNMGKICFFIALTQSEMYFRQIKKKEIQSN